MVGVRRCGISPSHIPEQQSISSFQQLGGSNPSSLLLREGRGPHLRIANYKNGAILQDLTGRVSLAVKRGIIEI